MPDSNCNSPRSVSRIDASSIKATSASTTLEARDQSSAAHHPSISARKRLLGALWPSPDRCHQIGILDRQNHQFKNIPVINVADAVEQAQFLSSEGAEVYFACAEYLTPDSRTAANTSGACGFWMDIDCGEDKAAAGKGYPTSEAAEDALRQFCKDAELPEPTHIVHSGSGLHPYWVLDKVVTRDEWQSYARKLKALTKACGFQVDESRTADIASVLRIPGTHNHKYSLPLPVTLEYESEEPIEQSVMLEAIAVAHARFCGTAVIKQPSHPAIAEIIATSAGNAHADIYGPPDLERLSSALVMLDPDCDEQTWKLKRLAPLAEAARHYPDYGAELYDLARSWSSGELRGKTSTKWVSPGGNGLTGEQAFNDVWQRFLAGKYTGTPTTLGTVYFDAMQAGWADPTRGEPDDQFKIITTATGEDA